MRSPLPGTALFHSDDVGTNVILNITSFLPLLSTSPAGMTAFMVVVAQTKVGFLTGGRGQRFRKLPEEDRHTQEEEAYARATVALTRARKKCVIFCPLDMKGLIGAATVMGSLMSCLADAVLGVFPTGSPLIKQLFQFQQSYPQPPNWRLAFKPCSCGSIHGYLTTLLPLPKGAPLHVGDPPTNLSDFVIQFDGGAYRDLKLGGAGVILWRHTHGALEPMDSISIPIYPCADAAHAEACGAAHAVLLAAKHYPQHQPSKILIKGDNRTVIDFMTHKGKFRRSDLQQLLEEAQHVLAFALPPVIWSYTPREFNRCADYLAGAARDHVKEHFTQSSQALCGLLPFFFPLPTSLLSQFSSPPILRILTKTCS